MISRLGMNLCMDPRWSRLCRSEETERVLLERLECSGLSAHVKLRVQSAIEHSSMRAADVEDAMHRAIAAEGISPALYVTHDYALYISRPGRCSKKCCLP